MLFSERLNQYMKEISCTGKELAQNSGLSETVISRYRNGERIPALDSTQLKKLSDGIALTAQKRGTSFPETEIIFQTLSETLRQMEDAISFSNEKFHYLIEELNLNISRMATFLHYDASYISKVRSGKRKPSDPVKFTEDVCDYIVKQFSDNAGRKAVASIIGTEPEKLSQNEKYLEELKAWLCSGTVEKPDYISGFLRKMDEFDLDDYIRAIHFDTLKVPKISFQFPVSRHYYGLKEIREAELDFLKNTVLSKSMEPLYLCSDMPVEDMTEDENFAKKYMFGLAMVLKKGLHIHIIHDVDRPMKEMMLGLENWVPLYMTGQISPYYMKEVQNHVYGHLHFTSGAASMTGDCISGHHDLAHYYLTNNKEEVKICRKNMEFLLKKASPLMNIYRDERKEELYDFLRSDAEVTGKRRRILAAPPLFILSEKMLTDILNRNHISGAEQNHILEYARNDKEFVKKILSHSELYDELSDITEQEYAEYPMVLPLSGCFLGKDILISYEEFCSLTKAAEKYSESHKNYHFHLTQTKHFRNIQINYHEGKWCMVSKNRAPAIHFVIHHPKLRRALEQVSLPIMDHPEKEEQTD